MKKSSLPALIILMSFIFIFSRCNQGQTDNTEITKDSTQTQAQTASAANGGFESQVAWGNHIVTIAGCNDCHTPKKMGPAGPEDNMDLELSGSPSQMPGMILNRKEMESKGLAATNMLEWIGPWGISYTANITSDSTTGIGNWTEDQFLLCIRKGKYGGAPEGRNLLPPMPWPNFAKMTDDELKAVYAYLESTKPIHNIVPQPQSAVLAMKK
jgi:predicted CxxxxCH...CXXCH cytochrome family protein